MYLLHFSIIDYIAFALMFGFTCIFGIFFRNSSQSTGNSYMSRSKTHILPVSFCLVASTLSGVSLLGLPSEVYMHGTQISVMVISIAIMGIVNNYIYLPVFYELSISNPLDYLELRFDYNVKKTASIFCAISVVLSLPLIIYVPSLALTQVTGFDLNIISSVMFVVCTFYATIVQLKTTEWISSIQLLITIVTLGIVLVMGTISVGGISNILVKSNIGRRLEFFNLDFSITARCTFWTVTIGNIFSWLGFVAVHSSGVQRFTSFQTIGDAKKALIIFLLLASVTKVISCFAGLIIYTRYMNCDPFSIGYMQLANEIVPFYVLEVASKSPGLSGMFVAGLFSTALNTLSTSLSSIASGLFDDLIVPLVSDEVAKKITYQVTAMFMIVIAMISTASIVVIERLGSVLELFQCAHGITGGPVLGLFTLGMLFPKANKKGALYGGYVSAIIMALIVTQHLIEVWTGKLVYQHKDLNTNGCSLEAFIYSGNESTTSRLTQASEEEFSLSKISFHYYYALGTLITVVIGLTISCFSKNETSSTMNSNVFSPCIRKLHNLDNSYIPI